MREASTSDAAAQLATTLYFGNLNPLVSAPDLHQLCSSFGKVEHLKIIKDKATGLSAGYGFVRFADKASAETISTVMNGKLFFGQQLRVNWAVQSHNKDDASAQYHLFVGDLAQDVTDSMLYNAFKNFRNFADARVMWDSQTKRSKGYGFVSFRTQEDAQHALTCMNEYLLGSRRIRLGWAQHKLDDNALSLTAIDVDRADPLNTTIYVGNIPTGSSEHSLCILFMDFGTIVNVKINHKGGYGFVKFKLHNEAVKAIITMNGKLVDGKILKCSWGKSSSTPAAAAIAAAAAAASLPSQPLPLMMGMMPQMTQMTPMMMPSMVMPMLPTQLSSAAHHSHASVSALPPPPPRGLFYAGNWFPGT